MSVLAKVDLSASHCASSTSGLPCRSLRSSGISTLLLGVVFRPMKSLACTLQPRPLCSESSLTPDRMPQLPIGAVDGRGRQSLRSPAILARRSLRSLDQSQVCTSRILVSSFSSSASPSPPSSPSSSFSSSYRTAPQEAQGEKDVQMEGHRQGKR